MPSMVKKESANPKNSTYLCSANCDRNRLDNQKTIVTANHCI